MYTITAVRAGRELAEFSPVAPHTLARYLGQAQRMGADTIRIISRRGQGYTLHPRKGQ